MGTLSPCSAAPMPFGVAVPQGAPTAYGGGYVPSVTVPTYAPSAAGGGDALAGLAQIVTMLSLAVQQLAATLQATSGSAQLGPSVARPTTASSTAERERAPVVRRPPAALLPKRETAPAPAPEPAPSNQHGPKILANGMAFPVKDGKIIQGPHSDGTHSSGPWHDSNALDIEAPEGTPIYAPADGVVSNAKGSNDNPSGRTNGFNMFLEGADNEWFLTHMSQRLVNNGDHVKKGQLIGYVGSANNVPHLHIGQKHGNPADTFKL